MTNRIEYDHSESPSFPYVDVKISNVFENNYTSNIGKLDTGAFITVIPKDLIMSLNLKQSGTMKAGGFDSPQQEYDVYVVNMKINGTMYEYVKVITRIRTNILIGRDLINLWQMELDGQNHIGKFAPWSNKRSDAS